MKPKYLGPDHRAQQQLQDARRAARAVELLAQKVQKRVKTLERRQHPLSNAKLRRAMKPKRIRPVSTRRAATLKLYAAARDQHLKVHPVCQKCGWPAGVCIHHQRGRVGKLLYDGRYFKSLCKLCHLWAHQFPKQAQEMGYLAAPGEWNQAPK
jgi:hypothetical protein